MKSMTITLNSEQEFAIQQAIQNGVFRSVDEFIEFAITALPARATQPQESGQPSRLWELRKGVTLGDTPVQELIQEGRE
jgi:Arc/MetJ-type ribon-helix-helix transcriptional regulator